MRGERMPNSYHGTGCPLLLMLCLSLAEPAALSLLNQLPPSFCGASLAPSLRLRSRDVGRPYAQRAAPARE